MTDQEILNEIDKMHLFSNQAMQLKKFDDYINVFSDDLVYKQWNGKVINKKEFKNQYKRNNYSIEGNRFIENLTQRATVSIKVFFFFTKNGL